MSKRFRKVSRSLRSSFATEQCEPVRRTLFKARAKEQGSVKLIDIGEGSFGQLGATCPSPSFLASQLQDARIPDELVRDNERMLTDGFYAEVTLSYDSVVGQEHEGGRAFAIDSLRPFRCRKRMLSRFWRVDEQNSQHRDGLSCCLEINRSRTGELG